MPSPAELAIAKEEWQRFLHQLSVRLRSIFQALCDGNEIKEIALEHGLKEDTIRHIIRRGIAQKRN